MQNKLYEIERKFLVTSIPFSLQNFSFHTISQSYLHQDPTIRIRQIDDTFILTIKGNGTLCHEEYELDITKEQYEKLLLKVETPSITKTRYLIPLEQSLVAELDIYEGNLKGLMTVEVEFKSEKEAIQFQPPVWFAKDVTDDKRYKNTSLSVFGIPCPL